MSIYDELRAKKFRKRNPRVAKAITADHEKRIAELSAENEALKAENEALKAENEALNGVIGERDATIKELTAKSATQARKAAAKKE